MTNDQFEALIGRLEHQALSDPNGYTSKVLLLAVLGNAYVVAMLLLIVALLVALVASVVVLQALAIKLILVVGFFLWMLLTALWVKIDRPTGTEIEAGQAPELFTTVEGLRRRLSAPRFHHTLITEDFNAGVVQSPRLGIFGWPRNYLLIGLPLIKALTVEQFKAVLAHEFGHLAKRHGKVSNWIYRQRLRWSRLLAVLDTTESRGSFLLQTLSELVRALLQCLLVPDGPSERIPGRCDVRAAHLAAGCCPSPDWRQRRRLLSGRAILGADPTTGRPTAAT